MTKRFFFTILLSFTSVFSFSQSISNLSENFEKLDKPLRSGFTPDLIFKVNPSPIFSFYSSFMFGLEHRIYRNLYMQYEGGRIKPFGDNWDYKAYQNLKGGRGTMQLRYYAEQLNSRGIFFGVEATLRLVNYERKNTFGFDCEEFANCAYFRYIAFKETDLNKGLGICAGAQDLLWERITFEFSGSIGLNHSTFSTFGKPVNFSQEYGKVNSDDHLFSVPYITLSLRLGIAALKK